MMYKEEKRLYVKPQWFAVLITHSQMIADSPTTGDAGNMRNDSNEDEDFGNVRSMGQLGLDDVTYEEW